MKTALITGARGFIGRNLAAHLRERDDVQVLEFNSDNDLSEFAELANKSDVIFHLAGVNRPQDDAEFETGNAGLTGELCRILSEQDNRPRIVLTSSIQAERDNAYGRSKRKAEETLLSCSAEFGLPAAVFRLKNVFGKWCRPNYNSVVATFCHNISHDLPIQINDPSYQLELVHVDDVVAALVDQLDNPTDFADGYAPADLIPSSALSLGDLADRLRSFRAMQQSLVTPDFSDRFNQQLYSTYLSYLEPSGWEYGLEIKTDNRGNLAEFIKSPWFGQIFVSRTVPGITRGNHYHHVKTEKFLVISGEGLIRFRHIDSDEILEFNVRGEDYRVVDIPPGFTHSITNVGDSEMITLFWASEVFDPERPDTHFLPVECQETP